MFWSFVARVRICGQHECRKKLFDKHVRVQNHGRSDSESRFFQKRLRYLEVPIVHIPGATHHYCLRTDVKKTTLEYEKMIRGNVSQDDYLCRLETNILRQKQILEHAKNTRILFLFIRNARARSKQCHCVTSTVSAPDMFCLSTIRINIHVPCHVPRRHCA